MLASSRVLARTLAAVAEDADTVSRRHRARGDRGGIEAAEPGGSGTHRAHHPDGTRVDGAGGIDRFGTDGAGNGHPATAHRAGDPRIGGGDFTAGLDSAGNLHGTADQKVPRDG